eukprot:01677_5
MPLPRAGLCWAPVLLAAWRRDFTISGVSTVATVFAMAEMKTWNAVSCGVRGDLWPAFTSARSMDASYRALSCSTVYWTVGLATRMSAGSTPRKKPVQPSV